MTFNVVDIFGYEPDFATVSFRMHDVVRRGATNRPDDNEHGPLSLHVFRPRDGVVSKEESSEREPFVTVDFFTANPGRADTLVADTDCKPADICVEMENV